MNEQKIFFDKTDLITDKKVIEEKIVETNNFLKSQCKHCLNVFMRENDSVLYCKASTVFCSPVEKGETVTRNDIPCTANIDNVDENNVCDFFERQAALTSSMFVIHTLDRNYNTIDMNIYTYEQLCIYLQIIQLEFSFVQERIQEKGQCNLYAQIPPVTIVVEED